MDFVMQNGFNELQFEEMVQLDGGKVTAEGLFDVACKSATSAVAGCIVASFFPAGAPAYIACVVTAEIVNYVWENV